MNFGAAPIVNDSQISGASAGVLVSGPVQIVKVGPNRIEAKTENIQSLRFYLNDQMVDFSRPLTVLINGKVRFEGFVKSSIDEMLKDQLFLGRGWRYFTAFVDIDFSNLGGATRPTTRPATTQPRGRIEFTR